jgi:hypothetical protein
MEQQEIAALGASLREIDPNLLTPARERDVTKHWYQGGESYFDLFVDLRRGQVEWFQFTLRGKSLTWKRQNSGWRTGRTNELQTDDMTFYPGSKLIECDGAPDWDFIKQAHSILQTRAGEEVFDQILAIFETENERRVR